MKKKQIGRKFMEKNNFVRSKRKNCREMCYRKFRMLLLYSKLILFKKGLLMLI